MRKFLTLAILSLFLGLTAEAQIYIFGTRGTCIGYTETLFVDSMAPSGTWSSSNTAVATIGSSSGIVTGISAGTSVITFVNSATTLTAVFTVSPVPSAITGSLTACVGTTSTLSNTAPGGTWYSFSSFYAAIDMPTGVVTGVNVGTVGIQYTLNPGCTALGVFTVTPSGVAAITGPSTVCAGSTGTFSSATTSGAWSVSPSAVASISATGVLTGLTTGTAIVSYTATGSCGTTTITTPVSVVSSVYPGIISGPASVNAGAYINLTASVSGGTWSSSPSSVAAVSASGVVTGVSVGTATITYTVSGCGGPAIATKVVTVNPFGGISGYVLFASAYYGPVKVWLIKYNPATLMLTASDSSIVYSSGSSAFYQFTSPASDSYRVKAHIIDSIPATGTTGYVPTYHTGSIYWSSASVINHTAGVADINKNINMAFGTASSGPGFIAGNVMSGANKGTATSVPAVGLLIYIVNPTTGNVIQHTYTDASGNYSFSNLPIGQSYRIYPELINYETTPFPLITLTPGTTSMTAANFEQRTVSNKIVPIITGVSPLTLAAPAMYVYPNPSVNQVNIEVNAAQPENGTLVITDVVGREQYRQNVQSNGHFAQTLDVTHFAAGVYFISYDAGTSHYKQTISIKH